LSEKRNKGGKKITGVEDLAGHAQKAGAGLGEDPKKRKSKPKGGGRHQFHWKKKNQGKKRTKEPQLHLSQPPGPSSVITGLGQGKKVWKEV